MYPIFLSICHQPTRFILNRNFNNRFQVGFTLVELAIVGLFLGLLSVFAISQFNRGVTSRINSEVYLDVANKVGTAWAALYSACSISPDISSIDLTTGMSTDPLLNAKNNLKVLFGLASISPQYSVCYSASGIRPLQGSGFIAVGTDPGFENSVVTATYSDNSLRLLNINFSSVNDQASLFLLNKLDNYAGTSLPTNPVDTNRIHFDNSVLPSGGYSVTIKVPI